MPHKQRDTELAVGPRILLLDIETAPIAASVFDIWQQNVGLNQIQADWYCMAWAAKWLDEKTIHYYDQSSKKPGKAMEDDRQILRAMHKLLDEADLVVGHNARKFDVKKLNARFLRHGFMPPSPYRVVDTLDMAKAVAKFTSNKLEYIAGVLCPDLPKRKRTTFPGFELWSECAAGNPKAWREMRLYNMQDVRALEGVYLKLRGWYQTHPNVGVFYEDERPRCKCCGSLRVHANGWRYTNANKYRRWRCRDCGASPSEGFGQIPTALRRGLLR